MIRSLRGRLFLGLTAVIVLTGAVAGVFTYWWAYDEAIEIQDSALMQLASITQGGGPLPHRIEEDGEVWLLQFGRTPPDSADDRQLFALKDGLQMASRNGQSVRLLRATRADGTGYAIGQPAAIRDETARNLALRTLLPLGALVPCLLLVAGIVINGSLRPVVRLAGQLDARPPDDVTPLPLVGLPSELHPFVASINGLLLRGQRLMEQQRRFVADAAHELRTPIAALSLQAENLEAVSLSAEARDRAIALREGVQRTRRLLEQLLALARHDAAAADSAGKAPTSLDEVAKAVVADLLPQARESGVDLGFNRIEPLRVRGEPVILAAIVRNLLDNALRFTPPNGRIDVAVYVENGAGILRIDDSGPGIAPAELDRIFEPFFRGALPQGDGSGLGLSIVKRLVTMHGGTVALENVAASGLRATVRFAPEGAEANRS